MFNIHPYFITSLSQFILDLHHDRLGVPLVANHDVRKLGIFFYNDKNVHHTGWKSN